MISKKNAYIISETHWDREWYLTFEQFRAKLVRLTDKLLRILDTDNNFRHWIFDGQTIVLEDYLAVKPYEKEHLEKYIRNGRIHVGPWYILPDEFLISGESIIRNLLRGYKIAKSFGKVMKVGYVPDPFGHISQMPQILQGFGINSFIFTRGMDDRGEELGTDFWWEAPNGSKVLAVWLKEGYGNIAGLPEDIEESAERVMDTLQKLEPYVRTRNYLLMNGSDHLEPQEHIPQLIDYLNKTHTDWNFVHGTLEDYVNAVLNERRELKTYKGELRGAKYHYLLTGVLSSRAYLKRMNEEAQHLIEKVIEPISTISWILSGNYEKELIDTMWKYLLQNHPHDSICGCSIDEVHRDNEQRYKWIHEIGKIVYDNAIAQIQKYLPAGRKLLVFNPNPWSLSGVIIAKFKLSDVGFVKQQPKYAISNPNPKSILEASKNEIHVAFMKSFGWDPTPENEIKENETHIFDFDFTNVIRFMGISEERLRKTISVFKVAVDSNLKIQNTFGRKYFAENIEPKSFIIKKDNKELRTQVIKLEPIINNESNIISEDDRIVHLAIEVDQIPALGYECFDIQPRNEADNNNSDVPVLENELLRIEINPENGSLTIYDKETNITYENIHVFEDDEDAGDEYDYSPAVYSKKYTTIKNPPVVSIENITKGNLVQYAKINLKWSIPKSLTRDKSMRSSDTVNINITTTITLKKNSKILEFETIIDNKAKDHRLRVLFPTYTNSTTSVSDSLFDVIERSAILPSQENWVQKLIGTHPFRKFVDVSNDAHGLALFAFGIPEFELKQDANSTIALTLFRSIGVLSGVAMQTRKMAAGPILETPEAQCIRTMKFNYAIYPHKNDWKKAKVVKYANQYYTGLDSFIYYNEESNSKLDQKSFIQIKPDDVILSALKMSEKYDSVILRIWNPYEDKKEVTIDLWDNVSEIIKTTLEEIPRQIVAKNTKQFRYTIQPKEIASFEIRK